VSEEILNGTSAQLGYTVPFTLVHTGKYMTEGKIKIQTIHKLNTTQKNKKAQLTLSNPRDVKVCKNCSNSTCFVSFHRIPFPQIANA